MAEVDLTFVEVGKDDNGYDFGAGVLGGATQVIDVSDLVDEVLGKLGPNDCIRHLTIIGHGAPGDISVGNGMSGADPNKSIANDNEDHWGPELDRLACRFCNDDEVFLRGCNVGADQAGADLLIKIAKHLRCATVRAPTGLCNPLFVTGEIQEAGVGQTEPSKPIPGTNYIEKIKKFFKGFFKTVLFAGEKIESLERFDPKQVVGARYLPRILGRPFELELIEQHGIVLPESLVASLARGLARSRQAWLPAHGFALQGYLQLQIQEGHSKRWVTPGALIGGATGYSALRQDTSIVYLLPRSFTGAFNKWFLATDNSAERRPSDVG